MQDKIKVNLKFVVSQNSKPYFESSALTGDLPKIYFKTLKLIYCFRIYYC